MQPARSQRLTAQRTVAGERHTREQKRLLLYRDLGADRALRVAIQGIGAKGLCPIVQPLIKSCHELCLYLSAIVHFAATKGQ
jgi:hypothetical protein